MDLKEQNDNLSQSIVRVSAQGDAAQLLARFCQELILSEQVTNTTYLAIGTMLQMLFEAHDSDTQRFNPAKLGKGIRNVQACDRVKQRSRLAKKHDGHVPLNAWGRSAIAHADHAMEESLGVVQWSIQSLTYVDWAFTIMVDVRSEVYKQEFEALDLPVCDVLSAACELFTLAQLFLRLPSSQTEQAGLLRSVGRAKFEAATKIERVNHAFDEHMMTLQRQDQNLVSQIGGEEPPVAGNTGESNSNTNMPETATSKKKAKRKVKKPKKKKAKSQQQHVSAEEETTPSQAEGQLEPHESTSPDVPFGDPHPSEERADPTQDVAPIDTGDDSNESVETEQPQDVTTIDMGSDLNQRVKTEERKEVTSTSTRTEASKPVETEQKSVRKMVQSNPWTIPASMSATTPWTLEGQQIFRFNILTLHMKCRYGPCFIMASSDNPTATICPRCGIYCYVRYCSVEHMKADMRRHYCGAENRNSTPECGNLHVPIAIDELSVGTPISPVRPYISEQTSQATERFTKKAIERHRQAVYRSMSDTDDYFIFDDIDRIAVPSHELQLAGVGAQKYHLNRVRGTGEVCATITFLQSDMRRQRFNDYMNYCLSLGFAAGTLAKDLCASIFDVIVEDLSARNLWNEQMCHRLCVQMGFEFGYRVPEDKLLNEQDAGEEEELDESDVGYISDDPIEKLNAIIGGREYP